MPSLRDSHSFPTLTRHFRAGLSHTAAVRLDLRRFGCAVFFGILFSPALSAKARDQGFENRGEKEDKYKIGCGATGRVILFQFRHGSSQVG